MIRVPIRTKLAAALAVPLVGLCAITAIEVADTSADVERVHHQTELARASIGPSGILTRLQNERTWTVVELIGAESLIQSPSEDYAEAREQTDEAIAAFRDTIRQASEEVEQAYQPALDNLAALEELRRSVDGNTDPRGLDQVPFANGIFSAFSDLTEPFFEATDRVAIAVDDAELRQWTTLVGRSSELVAASFDHDLVDGFSTNVEPALPGAGIGFELMLASLNVPAEEGYMG